MSKSALGRYIRQVNKLNVGVKGQGYRTAEKGNVKRKEKIRADKRGQVFFPRSAIANRGEIINMCSSTPIMHLFLSRREKS